MYNSRSLIPAKFLTLISHFTICVCLLWSSQESVKACLVVEMPQQVFLKHYSQITIGLSLAVAMISFELLAFITGFTMFSPSSALLSTLCHASASVLLSALFINNWQCCWFWWIFAVCSVIPFIVDSCSPPPKCGGLTRLLILAGISTTIGSSLVVGYSIGVLNTAEEVIKGFCNKSLQTRYNATASVHGLDFLFSVIVSIFLVGGAIGSLTGCFLANLIGRKGCLSATSSLAVLSALLFYASKSANSVEMLVAGRFLVGLSSGLTTNVVPMYLTEIAPLKLRGSMGVLCPLGVTLGVLVGQIMSLPQVLGTEDLWPYLLSVYLIPVLICAAAIPFLPESPKYLYVIKKLPDVALRELSRVRGIAKEHLNNELEELKREEEDHIKNFTDSWSIKRVIFEKSLLLPLLLVCCLQAGQQFSGINGVFYYSTAIFKSAGLSRDARNLGTIGAGCCNLLMAITSIPVMSRYNRRSIITSSLVLTSFFLFLLPVVLLLKHFASWLSYMCILAVMGFVISYGIGLGPIPYFIGCELFETGPRPAAMALGSMCNWTGNFIVGLSFSIMQASIGPSVFFIFMIVTLLLLLFIRFYLPETRGRNIIDVANVCRQGLNSKPLSFSSPTSSLSLTETFPVNSEKA